MPLVPVIVSVNVPVLVLVVVEMVNVDVVVGVTGVGSEQVAPVGQLVTLRATLPLNPFNAVTVTVDVVVPPWVTVTDDGAAATEKSGAGAVVPVQASTSVMRLQASAVRVM
jgi:hypothetical protein